MPVQAMGICWRQQDNQEALKFMTDANRVSLKISSVAILVKNIFFVLTKIGKTYDSFLILSRRNHLCAMEFEWRYARNRFS